MTIECLLILKTSFEIENLVRIAPYIKFITHILNKLNKNK